MPTLQIGDTRVKVGDEFLRMTPEQQHATVEEIVKSIGAKAPDKDESPKEEGPAGGGKTRAGLDVLRESLGLPPKETATPDTAVDAKDVTKGVVRGVGRGVVEAIPQMGALAYDAVQGVANLGYRGIDAVLGTDLGPRHTASYGGAFGTSGKIHELSGRGADLLVDKPTSPTGRVVEEATSGATQALTGAGAARVGAQTLAGPARLAAEALAEAPKVQAAYGAGGAAGGQIAQEKGVNPLLGTVAGIAATAVGHGTGAGLVKVGNVINRNVERSLPHNQEVVERLAREKFRGAASDPDAALRAIEEGAAAEVIPGSRPTTFQATGDKGLGSLERAALGQNDVPFVQRAEEQNAARQKALSSIEGGGNVDDMVAELARRRDAIDAAGTRAVDTATSRADTATEGARPVLSPEEQGAALRDPMVANREAARLENKKLWDAVDPDGSLTITTGVLKQAVTKTLGGLTQAAKLGLSAGELEVQKLIRSFGSAVPFQELRDLRSHIGELVFQEKGRPTPTAMRLNKLKDAIDAATDGQITKAMNADEGLFQRTQSALASPAPDAPSIRPPGAPQQGARAATGAPKMPLSEFIAKHGGLPLDAESAARDWGNVKVKGKPLAHAGGRGIDDYWRQTLMEEGYLAPDDYHGAGGRQISRDVDDEVRRILEDELGGRARTTESTGRLLEGPERDLADARALIADRVKREGVSNPDRQALDDAARMYVDKEETHPTTAYERALTQREDVPAAAPPQQDVPLDLPPGERGSTAEVDPEAGRRYREARQSHAQFKTTYDKGQAGQVLRKSGEGGEAPYKVSDAGVPAKAFQAGPKGGEAIRALKKAGATDAALLESAAGKAYGEVLDKNGRVNPDKWRAWEKKHESALNELPADIRNRFRSAADATRVLSEVAAQHVQNQKALAKSAVSKVLGIDPDNLTAKIGPIIKSASAMQELSQAVRGSPEAVKGLKTVVTDWFAREVKSMVEEGTSGEVKIKADALRKILRDHQGSLRQVLSGDEIKLLENVAADIGKTRERSGLALKDPYSSGTARDIGRIVSHSGMSILTRAMGPGGEVVGGVGKALFDAAKAAGLSKVDDLVREALLHPEVARRLLVPIPTKAAAESVAKKIIGMSALGLARSMGR